MSAFDKKKTVTDMEFVNLLESDVAYRQAKMGIYFSTHSMQQFNEAFFYWKKDYRGRYSERYLERSGFEPNTPAVSLEIDDVLVLDYLRVQDPQAIAFSQRLETIPEPTTVGRKYMQDNGYIWTNHDNTLVLGEITYNTYSAEYIDMDENRILLTFTKVEEAIDDVVHTIEIVNDFYHTNSLIMAYSFDGANPTHYRIYIEDAATVPWDELSTLDQVTFTAIVPLKEDNVLSKDTLQLSRMLNRMGLGGGDLMDSLTWDEENDKESPIDNAYIIEGLPFDTQNDVNATPEVKNSLAMALYRSFEFMSINNATTFSIEKLQMSYTFSVNIEDLTNEEDVTDIKVGQYRAELIESGSTIGGLGAHSYVIYFRDSIDTYKKMTVTNFMQTFVISGATFYGYMGSESSETRLIIPLDILNDLPFRDFVAVHERSFSILVYATETYTVKWYQRGIFSFILVVLVTYFTAGAGTAFATVLVNAAINFAIAYAVGMLVSMIDNEFLALVVTIALVLLGAYAQGFDFSALTVENYLPMANKAIDNASSIYSDYVQKQMEKIKEEAKEQAEKDEEMLDSMEPGFEVTRAMMDAHFSYMDANGPSTWINQMLGENLMNFDQYFNPTAEIELRKQVTAG